MTNEETRKAFSEWLDMVAEEITSDDQTADLDQLVHEEADGSEWAIYYSKAADLIAASDNDTVEAAFSEVDRDGVQSFGQLTSFMAFYIVRDALSERVANR